MKPEKRRLQHALHVIGGRGWVIPLIFGPREGAGEKLLGTFPRRSLQEAVV